MVCSLAVLQEVDIDPALPAAHHALHRGNVSVVSNNEARDCFAEHPALVESVARLQGDADVKPRRAGRLQVGLDADTPQEPPDGPGDLYDAGKGCLLGIQVYKRPVRGIQAAFVRHPRMKVDAARVDEGEKRLSVVAHGVEDRTLPVAGNVNRLHLVEDVLGKLLLVERLAADAVRPTVQVQGSVLEIREDPVGHPVVVAHKVSLRVALIRPIHLSRVCYHEGRLTAFPPTGGARRRVWL